jgi:predicted DNA-binding protein with PD1-like motif
MRAATLLSGIAFLAACQVAPNRLTDRVPPGRPVPSPLTFASRFERVVLVRMTYETDMLEALNRAVRDERIRNAVILSGIGSLKSHHLHAVSNTTLPSQNVFFKGEGPWDLTAVNGYVVDGRVHCHVTISNDKQALAGHLEPGTRTFTFVIVTLGVFGDEVDLSRLDDKEWR